MTDYTKDMFWTAIILVAEQNGGSLTRLAEVSGINHATLTPVRHQRNWPSLQTLAKILNTLQVSLQDFGEVVDAIKDLTEAEHEQVREDALTNMQQDNRTRGGHFLKKKNPGHSRQGA